jgi:DNA-binding MarR family transcriptional regulator
VRPRRMGELVNQLMWTIVLPYLGPAAAARELRRGPLAPAARPLAPARGLADGLELRMTYRTARVLAAIAEEPGASNIEIAARVDVTDQGQISRLLARLAHLGLIENSGSRSRGAANAWHLTPRGSDLDAAFARRLLAGASRQTRRRDV